VHGAASNSASWLQGKNWNTIYPNQSESINQSINRSILFASMIVPMKSATMVLRVHVFLAIMCFALLPPSVHSQSTSNSNSNSLRGRHPETHQRRALRQTESCTLLQRDIQVLEDSRSSSNGPPPPPRPPYDEWYCELRGKDRYDNDKQFVKVEGLDEEMLQGKPSGHTTLLAADAEFINGVLFLLPDKDKDDKDDKDDGKPSNGSSSGNKTNDDSDQEESSLDYVEEDFDQLYELIFGTGDNDTNIDRDNGEFEDTNTTADADADADDLGDTTIDQVNDSNDGDDMDDLSMTEDLDDINSDDTDDSENTLYIDGEDATTKSTGSDSFSMQSLVAGTNNGNVFTHNSDRRRILQPDKGDDLFNSTSVHSVLVVRVIANDTRTTMSRARLSNAIFGTNGNDMVNLKERFDKCSYGQLKMEPFNGTTASGRPMTSDDSDKAGVLNVRIHMEVEGQDPDDVMEAVLVQAEKRVGALEGQFDHVMLCLPVSSHAPTLWSSTVPVLLLLLFQRTAAVKSHMRSLFSGCYYASAWNHGKLEIIW
jgi:hypothetical protein